MGEKAKMVVNEYTGLGILLRPDFDVNKFYSSDLKVFITSARKTLEDYKTRTDKAIKDLFELKDMIYNPKTREENFEIQRKITSIIIGLGGYKE